MINFVGLHCHPGHESKSLIEVFEEEFFRNSISVFDHCPTWNTSLLYKPKLPTSCHWPLDNRGWRWADLSSVVSFDTIFLLRAELVVRWQTSLLVDLRSEGMLSPNAALDIDLSPAFTWVRLLATVAPHRASIAGPNLQIVSIVTVSRQAGFARPRAFCPRVKFGEKIGSLEIQQKQRIFFGNIYSLKKRHI